MSTAPVHAYDARHASWHSVHALLHLHGSEGQAWLGCCSSVGLLMCAPHTATHPHAISALDARQRNACRSNGETHREMLVEGCSHHMCVPQSHTQPTLHVHLHLSERKACLPGPLGCIIVAMHAEIHTGTHAHNIGAPTCTHGHLDRHVHTNKCAHVHALALTLVGIVMPAAPKPSAKRRPAGGAAAEQRAACKQKGAGQ